jgi:hypothetical protein
MGEFQDAQAESARIIIQRTVNLLTAHKSTITDMVEVTRKNINNSTDKSFLNLFFFFPPQRL